MSSISRIKQQKRSIIERHIQSDNVRGFAQILNTLGPLAALWYAVPLAASVSYWLTAGVVALMSLFLLRTFVLMHDCGHGSMFRNGWLNKTFGFVLGVVSGMPQYVWSQHHAYHHATNGNWAKYRGPLNTLAVHEYEALSDRQRRMYQRARNIWLAPFAGFVYLISNPRLTWLKGSVCFLGHIVRNKIARPAMPIKALAAEFKTPYWGSATEYWHMFWNNIALLSGWLLMCWSLGVALFFPVYVISLSLAGGAGIVLFTVQHNFEHSYAADDSSWDYDTAAIHGTSFLILPRWLNWFTANIAYHHIHHLSARIPNYRLAKCHEEYQDLFSEVRRIKLSRIHTALKYILWDTRAHRIISVAEYRQQAV